MKSGTEKKPNPHEISLGRFLRGLARPAEGYVRLNNGQLVREDTYERMKFERQQRRVRS